jgi:hypothetical protein
LQKGFKVFFDRERLQAGGQWVPELRQALADSKHLVAVWTDHAFQSPWVQRELATFDAHANGDPKRRLILMNLDGFNRAYGSVQGIDDLRNAQVYAGGAEAVEGALWDRVIGKIERAFNADADSVPIPLVVLTLRQQDFARLPPGVVPAVAQGLNITPEEVLARYGPTRLDWKPLGSARTIGEILDGLRDYLNHLAVGSRFRWNPEPETFWAATITDETKQFAREFLAAGLSVMVIDAIALHDQQVYHRLMSFQACLANQRTAIFVLPPFAGDPRMFSVRQWLKTNAHPYFEPYYEPILRTDTRVLAQCGISVADEEEMRRLLLVNVGQFLAGRASTSRPEYLTVGRR